MVSFWDDRCGNCGRDFEHKERKRRRRVPGKRGMRYVCQACADVIDAQATIDTGATR